MQLTDEEWLVGIMVILVVTVSWIASWLGQRNNSFGDTLGHKLMSLVIALLLTVGYNLVSLGRGIRVVKEGFDQASAVIMLSVMVISVASGAVLEKFENEKIKFVVFLGLVVMFSYLTRVMLVPYLIEERQELPEILLLYKRIL